MSRNYRKEYDNYHSRPEQKVRRAARNAARRLFADADPDKDVHHKDNNPLNNDKKNLSLVTQYYNRREPRLRDEAFPSGAGSTVLVHNNKVIAKGSKSSMLKQMKQIRKKTGDSHKKLFLGNSPSRKIGDVWKEEVELDEAGRPRGAAHIENERFWDLKDTELHYIIKDSGKAIQANPTASKATQGKGNWADQLNDAATVLYYRKKRKIKVEEVELDESPIVARNEVMAIRIILDKFEDLLRKSNFSKKQKLAKALGIKVYMRGKHSVTVEQEEEAGTVTGLHIAGTGDDSSTVIVKKKKKKKVYRREALKKRIIDNVLTLNKR